MGLINAIGALGGYFGPLVVGALNKRFGDFRYAFGALSAGLLAAAGWRLSLESLLRNLLDGALLSPSSHQPWARRPPSTASQVPVI